MRAAGGAAAARERILRAAGRLLVTGVLVGLPAPPASLGPGNEPEPAAARRQGASLSPPAPSSPTPASVPGRKLPGGVAPPVTSASGTSAARWQRIREPLEQRLRELRGPAARSSAVRRARGPGRLRRELRSLEAAGILRPLEHTAEVAGITHRTFRLSKRGLPVLNRTGRLHERDGKPIGATGKLAIPPLVTAAGAHVPLLTRSEAIDTARFAAGVRALRAAPRSERGWYAARRKTVPAWRVTIPAARPFGTFQATLDARSGRLLALHDLIRTEQGVGRLYPENAAATPALADLPLAELDGSGLLAGRLTQVFDVRTAEAFRPDLAFRFDPSDARFVQTAVYRGLTESGLFAEAHGFPRVAEPVLAFTNLRGDGAGDELNNAFYDPFFPLFGFGNGDGILTANLGSDLDVAAHEMGHHVFQQLVDPLLSSSLSALAAVNEGFADTLAAFLTGNPAIGESTRPGFPHLRTLANSATWPDGADPDPHTEGLIYGGLNWDLAQAVGLERATSLVVGALPFLDPEPDFPTEAYRRALLASDEALSEGRNRATLASLATARGLEDLQALGIQGFIEEGETVTGQLADGEAAFLVFFEFPDSNTLRVRTTGTGNADLLTGPLATLDFDDPSTFAVSQRATTSEFIELRVSSTPSIDADDVWMIAVADVPDGRPSHYELRVETDPPDPTVAIGGRVTGRLDAGGEIDFHTFVGAAGEIVRLEATALTPELDLAVVIFDRVSIEILGAADDSGEGLDPVIQGARLPTSDTFAIAVFSPIADVDPTVGTGDYRIDLSLCANDTGPDSDGDGLRDACDDDDDEDGFTDPNDSQPLDPARCGDVEDDGCDDCTSGSFDPFADGDDFDRDGLCDRGDTDDDNDGCADSNDPAPFAPSVDDDFDFTGRDCDNCPELPNPDQLDSDQDGLGDACDPTPVPEPGALGALAVLGALATRAWRRSHRGGGSTGGLRRRGRSRAFRPAGGANCRQGRSPGSPADARFQRMLGSLPSRKAGRRR